MITKFLSKEGEKYIILFLTADFFLIGLSLYFHFFFIKLILLLFVILTAIIMFFFRDPRRNVISDDKLIVSPADGTVVAIEKDFTDRKFLDGKSTKISIFLSLFNVHVQRAPISGRIEFIEHINGKFFAAWKKEASTQNEKNIIGIRNENINIKITLCQIAGVVARRIISWIKLNDNVKIGEKIGFIKFGSRVDIFIPEKVKLNVKLKEKVKAGISIIGVIQ